VPIIREASVPKKKEQIKYQYTTFISPNPGTNATGFGKLVGVRKKIHITM
jgi:hypothetical protein